MAKTILNLTQSSRVIICMPHPDDEAVFVSGLIKKITTTKIPLLCITFTRGEKSTLRFTLSPNEDLATARIRELTKSYQVLGVTDFKILDFPDGELEQYHPEVDQVIKKYFREFSPTHVVTLEPDGIYGHPDHIALSRCVTQAITHQQLVYTTVSERYIMPSARSMAKKSTIQPIKPTHKLVLTPSESLTKLQSLLCHRSQFLRFPRIFLSLIHFLLNDMLFHEYYSYKE